MKANQLIKNILLKAGNLLTEFLSNDKNINAIELSATMMVKTIQNGGKIIACGNGGSMSDAMHFTEELTGNFRHSRKPIPALSISDPAYITCVANDFGYDTVFSRFIEAHGQSNDVLVAISTSGNSINILEAVKIAKAKGMKVIALTGKDGGQLKKMADVEVRVPHFEYSDRIQEIHIKVIHIWIQLIESKLSL